MFFRLSKSRKFTYYPVYYHRTEEEEGGPRIKFYKRRTKRMTKGRSILWLLLIFIIVLYLFIRLNRVEKSKERPLKIDEMEIVD